MTLQQNIWFMALSVMNRPCTATNYNCSQSMADGKKPLVFSCLPFVRLSPGGTEGATVHFITRVSDASLIIWFYLVLSRASCML